MKKLIIGFMALSLTLSISSCKDGKQDGKMSDDVGYTDDDAGHDDDHGGHDDDHGGHDDDHGGHEDHATTVLMVGKELTVPMSSKSGSNVSGTITFKQGEKEVMMSVALEGLTEGAHAIHLHQEANCSSDDGKSAGGHWNPSGEDHGKWGDQMHHSGDIGNLTVAADGKASLEFSTDKWCIGCDDEKKNIIGRGVIVHAAADDFESQPSGAAGARVACGEIE